jgi:hypothetical protein
MLLSHGGLAEKETVETSGSGTGVYYPATGFYTTTGTNNVFGQVVGTGRVETFGSPPVLEWQNFGRGDSKGNGSPKNEVLERTITPEGTYYTRSKGVGEVELIAIFDDPDFDPALGPYTAEWTAEFEFVKGTGIFKGAKATIAVTALNEPFLLTDPEWKFTWTFVGNFELVGE